MIVGLVLFISACALASLAFLIVIHKLEYFLNARDRRHADPGARRGNSWSAMLVMEAAFGVGGVVAAPIYYAFVKDELKSQGLV